VLLLRREWLDVLIQFRFLKLAHQQRYVVKDILDNQDAGN